MPDERPSEVLGALPRTRPQRRSTKRQSPEGATAQAAPKLPSAPKRRARAASTRATRSAAGRTAKRAQGKRGSQPLGQPPQPRGNPAQPRATAPPHRPELLGTAVQAAAELAEIGLALSARAIRRAVSRIPRP